MTELLWSNITLKRIRFEENPDNPFTDSNMVSFCEMLRVSTCLVEISVKLVNKELGGWFIKDVKKCVREKWKWNHD